MSTFNLLKNLENFLSVDGIHFYSLYVLFDIGKQPKVGKKRRKIYSRKNRKTARADIHINNLCLRVSSNPAQAEDILTDLRCQRTEFRNGVEKKKKKDRKLGGNSEKENSERGLAPNSGYEHQRTTVHSG